MNDVNIGTSFLAGILSFLSPCVLPLVPGYISYLSGLSLEELSKESSDQKSQTKQVFFSSFFFVLGFSLVFTLLGASATFAGKFLAEHLQIFSKIAGGIIILFGLHTTGILPIRWLYYEKRLQTRSLAPGIVGSLLMGLAFAFGWTPCIGPILAGILALAATETTIFRGMFLLAVYSLGLGIPFILTGMGMSQFLKFFSSYKKFIRWGEMFAGILLIFIGVLIFSGRLTSLLKFIPERFYQFSM